MRTIGEVAQVKLGFHFRERIVSGPDYRHRIVQMKDFDGGGRLNLPGLTRIHLEEIPEKYLLHPGDILFLSKGLRNFAYCLKEPMTNVIASGLFFILRIKDETVLPEYLAWYINQSPAQTKIKNMAQGTQIPMISCSQFADLEVDIPPIEVQKIIIELDRLAYREKVLLQSLTEKRHQLIQALCRNLINHDIAVPTFRF